MKTRTRNTNELIDALDSIQSLDEKQCRNALEAFHALRERNGIEHADFVTILALRMRIAEFESLLI